MGQSSPLTTSGSSAVCCVNFSSGSPTQDPRHSPCRNPSILLDIQQQQSILWDNQHHPSILWDSQHQPLTIQPSNASSASLEASLASNRTRQVQRQPSRLTFQHNNKTRNLFRNGESFDSCAHHFAKPFEHELIPKPTQNIPEHDIVWHGNPAEQITEHEIVWRDNHMSVVKAFEILH